MTTEPNVRGFIIIQKTQGNGLLALTRSGRFNPTHWAFRECLEHCFVHSRRAVRRALQRERAWTNEAVFAYEAAYNLQANKAEAVLVAIPFNSLADQLLGVCKKPLTNIDEVWLGPSGIKGG